MAWLRSRTAITRKSQVGKGKINLTGNALHVELAGGVLLRIGNDMGISSIGLAAVRHAGPLYDKKVSQPQSCRHTPRTPVVQRCASARDKGWSLEVAIP